MSSQNSSYIAWWPSLLLIVDYNAQEVKKQKTFVTSVWCGKCLLYFYRRMKSEIFNNQQQVEDEYSTQVIVFHLQHIRVQIV